ncbi:uncharacterized protein METZ01_LOCUS462111 [marine metagenome]|uniref:Uncharacterized protein n=1 Tax=marine metagenome TaxID=408172 RepID=A0A383AN63_9ZZZZ
MLGDWHSNQGCGNGQSMSERECARLNMLL